MAFLAPNSDAIAQNTLTNGGTNSLWGNGGVSTPGGQDIIGVPIYYGTGSDPIYKITNCGSRCGTAGTPEYPEGTYWHIPNQAKAGNLGSPSEDHFFQVWDQTNNNVLGLYFYDVSTAQGTLPNCTATTQDTACPIPNFVAAQRTNYTTSKDYQLATGGGNSLGNGDASLVVRHQEWMNDAIHHPLYINLFCVFDSPYSKVFPANDGGRGCSTSNIAQNKSLYPKQGSLFFLDYTAAQIDAMNIPPYKKAIIRAMSYYGGYAGDTVGEGGVPTLYLPARVESGQAYELNGGKRSPFYAWLEAQGVSCTSFGASPPNSQCGYSLPLFVGIPAVTGPNCPTTACGIDKHLHIADECVAKGLAGLSGGCGTSSTPPLQPPANLRITNVTR
jgi:hypothetical protein